MPRAMLSAAALVLGVALGAAATAYGPSLLRHAAQPYAGQEGQAISSLSAADVAALEAGEGWGLAKPAELNDHPGPAHVIELADDLDLSADQRTRIDAAFAAMRGAAQEAGRALIAAERALDRGFERGDLDRTALRELLAQAEAARARLREVHLAAHLDITPVLSREQRERYATLRGYDGDRHGGH